MSRARIGLVGCGRWGLLILRDLMRLGAEVDVVDPSETARGLAAALGARSVARDTAALDADAFIVATPAVSHASVAMPLVGRGKPMLIEKPFATSVADALQLANAASDRIFVGHVWRYHPGVELLGEIARSGELGPVSGLKSVRANWTSPRLDVDTLWNFLPHDLTIAIEILGAIPEPRAALAEVHQGRAVGFWATLGGDPWLVIEGSNRHQDKRREMRLHCRDGVAVMADPDAGFIELAFGNAASREPRLKRRAVSQESALERQLRAFLDHVGGGPPPRCSASEGVDVVRSIHALRELAGLGRDGPS